MVCNAVQSIWLQRSLFMQLANACIHNVDSRCNFSEKLNNYGIKTVSDYVLNGSWLSKTKNHRKDGFDIFEEVTKWPEIIQHNSNYVNVLGYKKNGISLAKNNISTDMILNNGRKIMWKHGQCLSLEPPNSVKTLNL